MCLSQDRRRIPPHHHDLTDDQQLDGFEGGEPAVHLVQDATSEIGLVDMPVAVGQRQREDLDEGGVTPVIFPSYRRRDSSHVRNFSYIRFN